MLTSTGFQYQTQTISDHWQTKMKDSIYFSHDADARNDEKIIGLIMEHGMEGYGIFWSIIEMLRTATEHKMHLDYKRIAFALHVDDENVKSVIHGFELFDNDERFFWSESLLRRMNIKNIISEERRKAAKSRWDKAKAMQLHSKSNANDMQKQCNKVKEVKEVKKEKKEKEDTPKPPKGESARFKSFWDAYGNKTGIDYARKCFQKAVKNGLPDSDTLVAIIRTQKERRAELEASGEFVPRWPNPSTWLNQGRWKDELPEVKKIDFDGPNGDGIPF